MCIGDLMRERYQIVHKLGFGTFSTTWLARDEKAETYIAMKIAVADAESPPESEILRSLGDTDLNSEVHPGKAMIPSILEEFEIEGPNGCHQCLVTDVARASIAETREASYKRIFQLPVARGIASQLIQAVAFVHSQGVVHSGKPFIPSS